MRCDEGTGGDSSVRQRCECMISEMFWLEDSRGEKKIPRRLLLFLCLHDLLHSLCLNYQTTENNTKHSYLCSLSSSSFIYLVVFSFRQRSVRGERGRTQLLITCTSAFISHDVVSKQQITALIPLKLTPH